MRAKVADAVRGLAHGLRRLTEQGVCAVLAPFIFLAARALPTGDDCRKRWQAYFREGLSAWRAQWWVDLKLEPVRNVWRMLFLTEVFDLLNERDARDQSCRRKDASSGSRVLVVNMGHIGDMLFTVPLLRSIRRTMPHSDTYLLTGPWNKVLAKRFECLAKPLFYEPQWMSFSREASRRRPSIRGEIRQLLDVRSMKFELMVSCGSGGPVDWMLAEAVRPVTWVGADCKPAVFGAPSIRYKPTPYKSREYEPARLVGLLKLAGMSVDEDDLETELPLLDEERAFASRALGVREAVRVVLAPGAGWPGKIWPIERFRDLAEWFVREHGAQIVLVGTASEKPLTAQIAERLPSCVDLSGMTTLGQLGAVLEASDLLVSSDGGAAHISAAVGTATVVLFGPIRPEKWARRGSRHCSIRKMETCEGCYPWHPRARCGRNAACMEAISLKDVKQAARKMLRTLNEQN